MNEVLYISNSFSFSIVTDRRVKIIIVQKYNVIECFQCILCKILQNKTRGRNRQIFLIHEDIDFAPFVPYILLTLTQQVSVSTSYFRLLIRLKHRLNIENSSNSHFLL